MFKVLSPAALKWASLFSLILTGCSSGPGDMPKIAPVTGVVTIDGQPLPEAEILFQPASGRASTGLTDENGKYTLMFNRDASGAKIGPHDVSIITYKQFDQSLSKMTATVKEGDNVINLDLKSKPNPKTK